MVPQDFRDCLLKREIYCYRPQGSWGKFMFLHVSVILFMQGGVSQHALHVVSQHALQQVSTGGVSRPTPRGEVEGSGQGGLQVHTWGVSRPTRGVSRHTPGGLQAHTQGAPGQHLGGVYPSMHWGRHPSMDSYCHEWYASYWNAFLLLCRVLSYIHPCVPILFSNKSQYMHDATSCNYWVM